jgi:hypothetical protein
MPFAWEQVTIDDANWSKARQAIKEHEESDGYADALWVALAFGGKEAGFDDGGAANHLLERFNAEYKHSPNSFERHQYEPSRWRTV